jgi:hypothetical protein
MMRHAEAESLLGVYALDATEPEEAEALEAHLETCPRCRDELAAHREVVGLLAYAGGDAPAGLWDRVVASIHDPYSDAEPVESPGRIIPFEPRLATADPRSVRRLRRWARAVSAVAAVAAAAVAFLGIQVDRLQGRTAHLGYQVAAMTGAPTMATVDSALRVPGAQVVSLMPDQGNQPLLKAVILPGGQGYLYASRLAPLPPTETYQLWGVVGNDVVSYGIIGSTPPRVLPFRASAGVKALAVTEEVAGGVVQSTHKPVVVGTV